MSFSQITGKLPDGAVKVVAKGSAVVLIFFSSLYSFFIGCPCIIQICKFRYKKNLEIKDRKVPARHPLLLLLGPLSSGHRHEVTERLLPSHHPSPGPPIGPHPVRPWLSGRHGPRIKSGRGQGKHSIGSEHSVGGEEALSLCCVLWGKERMDQA